MRRNMRAERARAGLTIADAAKKLNVSKNAISRWEKEQSEPSAKNLIAMASLYDCTPEYLLGMTDERHGTAVA